MPYSALPSLRFFSLVACLAAPSIIAAQVCTIFLPKPQGFYQNNYIRPHDDTIVRNGQPNILAGTLAYRNSFRSSDIGRTLFATTDIPIVGSSVATFDPSVNLMADFLGLAPNFQGTLSVDPTIHSVTLDAFYHLDLTRICTSMYLEIGLPLVASRWSLNHVERTANAGDLTFQPSYMGAAAASTARSIQQAMSGEYFFGDMKAPWTSNRLGCGSITITRVPDVSLALGGTWCISDRWSLRAAALTLLPGGNKIDPRYLFTPIVGNTDHWELGATLIATFRHPWCENTFFEATFMSNVTHLFDTYEPRTFDLLNHGYLSRYGLLQQYTVQDDSSLVYDNVMISAGNFTTRRCQIGCPIQGDFTAQGTVQTHHVIIDGGYNFYGRTAERVSINCENRPCELQGKVYRWKGTLNAISDNTSPLLTRDAIDLTSGTAPSTKVHTLFLQVGRHWNQCWGEPALLFGTEIELGTYGCQKSLCQWGVWTHLRMRF